MAGNDTINLVGSLTAQNVNIFGGDGADTIDFSPTNVQGGEDVIFGDSGTVTFWGHRHRDGDHNDRRW